MDKKVEPRGIRNNNPLNIRKGNNWIGEKLSQTDPAFEQFDSMEFGIRAGFKILKKYITGNDGHSRPYDTIDKIIRRWAPESENDCNRYIQTVAKLTGLSPYERVWFVDRRTMVAIVDAMIFVECGEHVQKEVIETAYDLV